MARHSPRTAIGRSGTRSSRRSGARAGGPPRPPPSSTAWSSLTSSSSSSPWTRTPGWTDRAAPGRPHPGRPQLQPRRPSCEPTPSGEALDLPFHEAPESAPADERAVAHDEGPADDGRADRPAYHAALEWRVVARVVEVVRADRAARPWVEQDDVRVEAHRQRALRREPEQPCGRGGEQVDHALHADPTAGHARVVHDAEQRLDPRRAVRDPVERLAPALLLDRDPVGHMVRGDDREVAVGEAVPQRADMARRPERR